MCMKYEEYARLRDEKQISDYQVSKHTGISRSTFTQWKKGILTPAPHTQARLQKFFDEYDEYLNKQPSFIYTQQEIRQTQPTFGITVSRYIVDLPNGRSISLTQTEYENLQHDLESFLLNWASTYGKI